MDVNEHEILSIFKQRHKLKQRNSTCIAVLHFTVTLVFNNEHDLK